MVTKLFDLPPEILASITEELDQEAKIQLASTCKNLNAALKHHFFNYLHLVPGYYPRQFETFVEILVRNPALGRYARKLFFSDGVNGTQKSTETFPLSGETLKLVMRIVDERQLQDRELWERDLADGHAEHLVAIIMLLVPDLIDLDILLQQQPAGRIVNPIIDVDAYALFHAAPDSSRGRSLQKCSITTEESAGRSGLDPLYVFAQPDLQEVTITTRHGLSSDFNITSRRSNCNVERLRIKDTTLSEPLFTYVLASTPKLESLSINFISPISELQKDGFGGDMLAAGLESCRETLWNLTIEIKPVDWEEYIESDPDEAERSDHAVVSDSTISSLSKFPRLTSICAPIQMLVKMGATEADLLEVLPPQLESLEVSTTWLDDSTYAKAEAIIVKFLSNWPDKLPNLKCLQIISGPEGRDDRWLEILTKKCPHNSIERCLDNGQGNRHWWVDPGKDKAKNLIV